MQQGLKWSYYNHAIVPTTAPHETVDESMVDSKNFWKSVGGYPLLARWTTDFDCQEETDWWYIIKDKPFDFQDVDKRYQKQTRKGLKNFDVRIIDPIQYAEALYQVQVAAVSNYSGKRPRIDHDEFVASMNARRKGITFAAFSKEDNSIAGYEYTIVHDNYLLTSVLKAKPSYEKKQVNAALIFSVLNHFSKELAQGVYIMSGERTIYHQTAHQEYLVKKFAYRKAYCRLHIRYRPGVKQIVACLYPLRGLLKYLNGFTFIHQLNSVLKMEEIIRKDRSTHPLKETS